MLDNFDEPESPEKHSQGNGTIYKLDMYKCFLYRNACMLFIDYLQGEYKFPDVNLIENSIKINMQKDE